MWFVFAVQICAPEDVGLCTQQKGHLDLSIIGWNKMVYNFFVANFKRKQAIAKLLFITSVNS